MPGTALVEGVHSEFGLVGDSPELQRVLRIIKKLRSDTSPVLITGESGVGKELVARAVHEVSPLAGNVFLAVDAPTLTSSLSESELFGHLKGAFTGAIDNKIGLVRAAEGGTLFLDEIGELSGEVQAKLLRVLQEKEVRPVGATRPIKVKVRVIAATNRDLAEAVKENQFRRDLYYRLKVVTLRVPPLRDRRVDIPPLTAFFLSRYADHRVRLSDGVRRRLLEHSWPGNVRELENAVRYMVVMKSSPLLEMKDLPSDLRNSQDLDGGGATDGNNQPILPLEEIERRHILKAMEFTKNDMTVAAALLGIGKTTLYRKLKKIRQSREPAQGRLFG